jgi:AcrR family transcriptional regulator
METKKGEIVSTVRDRILRESIESLRREGLKFSVDTLADRLKISKKTVYKFFPDKEALALALYETYYADAKAQATALLDADGLVCTARRRPLLTAQTTLPLSHDLFVEDALLFESLRSRRVRLVSTKSGHGVELAFAGMPYFALWSPVKHAPFVCLEPWTGTATTDAEDDVFEHKRGMTLLPPGGRHTVSYAITVF